VACDAHLSGDFFTLDRASSTIGHRDLHPRARWARPAGETSRAGGRVGPLRLTRPTRSYRCRRQAASRGRRLLARSRLDTRVGELFLVRALSGRTDGGLSQSPSSALIARLLLSLLLGLRRARERDEQPGGAAEVRERGRRRRRAVAAAAHPPPPQLGQPPR
jgi:hypothetical protein